MRIGAHQSIAGGLHLAIEAADRDGCEALQIFSRNQQQWKVKPLTEESVALFRSALNRSSLEPTRILSHDSYLINVCAKDQDVRRKSRTALTEELRRCARLGIPYLIMHPGSHMDQGETRGLKMIAKAVSRSLSETESEPDPPTVLLENTAGQGTNLGHRFEHLRDLLADITPSSRVGICVDTQHTFAAGYDLSTEDGYATTFETIDLLLGIDRIRAFHLNDSKRELGCRVDRHEKIGRGHIGRTCFQMLMNDARFAELPGVLELPPPYPPQLSALRRMSDGTATAKRRPRRRG